MKICFPVETDNGFESHVYCHFGTAPFFVIFDNEKQEMISIENHNLQHRPGLCNPILALNGHMVDVVVVGGIGAGAVAKFKQMGVEIYKSVEGSVADNLQLFKADKLSIMDSASLCSAPADASR